MPVVPGDAIRFVPLPGRMSADPFAGDPGESSARQVVLEPTSGRSPHRHPLTEEVVYVAEGRGCVWLDGEFHPVQAGSWVRIPVGTPHATLADPGERLSLICFFPHGDLANNIEELDQPLDEHEERHT